MSINVSSFGKIESYAEGNVPVIKLKNINQLKSPFIHECDVRLDIKDFKRSKVSYGDILMIGNGSAGLAGRVFVYLGREECIVRQSV